MTRTEQIAASLRNDLSVFRLGLLAKVVSICFRCSPQTAAAACNLLVNDGLLTFDGSFYRSAK